MKLQVKVNPATGVIDDAKFKTFGCGSAIASSSLATEWLKGKTVDQALAIKNTDIVAELSLPPVKIHCSVLAEDAIKAAIADYKKKQAKARRHAGERRNTRSPNAARETMIEITETAAQKIKSLMAKQGISEGGLRVGVKGGGCSGLSYTFAWEKEPRLGDEVFEGPDGAKLFVDKKSLLFLKGTTLDYDKALLTQGIRLQQPERQADLRLRQFLRRVTRRGSAGLLR